MPTQSNPRVVVKNAPAFPLSLFDLKHYTGLRFLFLILFLLSLAYLGLGVHRYFNWENSLWRPDNLAKMAHVIWHLFAFGTAYVMTWLVFDRRRVEGYIFSAFSFLTGLIYLLLPVDIVPDALPVAGQMDDTLAIIATFLVTLLSFKKARDRQARFETLQAMMAAGAGSEAIYQYLESEGVEIRQLPKGS